MADSSNSCPAEVREYSDQVVEYVRRAVGVPLEFDSDTLPILDHYLRSVPADEEPTVHLVAIAGGAYFGEVVRRRLGGTWDLSGGDPSAWRMVLPGGLSFVPAGLVMAAILLDQDAALDESFSSPPAMLPVVEDALSRMGHVTEEEYYSLCGRLDTLEHLQAVLLAFAAAEKAKRDTLH